MNNWIKGIVVLAVMYCFAVFGDTDLNHLNFTPTVSSSQETYLTRLDKQGSVAICLKKNRLNVSAKNQLEPISKVFFLVSVAQEYSFQFVSQYNLYIKNCLIDCRKSDLLFPFHYYW